MTHMWVEGDYITIKKEYERGNSDIFGKVFYVGVDNFISAKQTEHAPWNMNSPSMCNLFKRVKINERMML